MTNTSPQDFIDFVLKLSSEASGLEKSVAIESVTTQLRAYEQSRFFPEVFTMLEPDNLHPTTKDLPEYQRDLLSEAIRIYSETYNH